jgi:exodeoxyribonuclease VIII
MRTTAGREAAAKWESENSGKNGIDPADEEASRRVVEAVMSHAEASKIMAAGDPQVAGLWVDKETGVLCKMRLDWLSAVISDLKVSVDVEADEFLKSMGTYGYHIQAAFYQDGYAAITGQRLQFVWIVAESKEPYRVRVYKANNQCLTAGRIAYRRGLYRYQLSQKANDWRDPQIIEEIGVPSWIAYAEGLEREQGNEF